MSTIHESIHLNVYLFHIIRKRYIRTPHAICVYDLFAISTKSCNNQTNKNNSPTTKALICIQTYGNPLKYRRTNTVYTICVAFMLWAKPISKIIKSLRFGCLLLVGQCWRHQVWLGLRLFYACLYILIVKTAPGNFLSDIHLL